MIDLLLVNFKEKAVLIPPSGFSFVKNEQITAVPIVPGSTTTTATDGTPTTHGVATSNGTGSTDGAATTHGTGSTDGAATTHGTGSTDGAATTHGTGSTDGAATTHGSGSTDGGATTHGAASTTKAGPMQEEKTTAELTGLTSLEADSKGRSFAFGIRVFDLETTVSFYSYIFIVFMNYDDGFYLFVYCNSL